MTMAVGIGGSFIGGAHRLRRSPAAAPRRRLAFASLGHLVRRSRGGIAAGIDPAAPRGERLSGRRPRGEIRDRGEQPLGVRLVVVVHEAGADRAVRARPRWRSSSSA